MLIFTAVDHGYQPPLNLGFGFRGGFSPVHTPLVVVSGCFRMFQDVSGSAVDDHAWAWVKFLVGAQVLLRRHLRRPQVHAHVRLGDDLRLRRPDVARLHQGLPLL